MAGLAPALSLAFHVSSASAPCDVPPEAPLPKAPRSPPSVERRATATPPGTSVTLAWVLTQLLPRAELAVGDDGAAFGIRWHVVPLLYSFGIDRRLSPFRAFVVEPLVRTSGSLELFVAPEYLWIDDRVAQRFGFRTGLRAHFPLIEKGDYLSVSLGTAYARFADRESASYQFGAYLLFGFLGFEESFLPALDEARFVTTLNVRFF